MICITEVYTEPVTMDTETEASVESGAAFKNEAAGFGGECLLSLYGHEQLYSTDSAHYPAHPQTEHSAPTRHK